MRKTIALHSLYIIALLSVWLPLSATAAGGRMHGETPATHPTRNDRTNTADEAAIQQLLNTYAHAMEQKSVALMEQAVMPTDFSTIESGHPNWTWDDFRDNHLKTEMEQFTEVSYDIDLLFGELQDTLGFGVFSYTASGKTDGKAIGISGLGTAVLKHTTDGWRLHHLHTSAPRQQLQQAEADLRPAEEPSREQHGHPTQAEHGD